VSALNAWRSRLRFFPLTLMVLVLGADGWQYASAFREVRNPSAVAMFPQKTLEWIRQSTPRDAFFLAPNASLVTLHTHRHALALIGARDAEEFRYQLSQRGITHILVTPQDFMYVQTTAPKSPTESWLHIQEWVQALPVRFQPVFHEEAERVTLYKVRPDPEFVVAYRRYLQARDALDQQRLSEGVALLQSSLDHFRLPAALNVYAAACLMRGQDLEDAQSALEEALALRPDFPIAALNLGRLHARLGHLEEARHYYELAQTLAASHEEMAFLLPAIRQELQKAAP
jgi:tetratricopeptide (TPR) repeat protein